jgi:2,4-didehydro-3-deoxy-L-rhamnonate hydrolase
MKLTGYRDGRHTIIACRTSDTTLIPIGEAEEFWADPYGALAGIGAHPPVVDSRDRQIVPAVRASARVLCVGLNYLAHAEEGVGTPPDYPTIFGRWTASLAATEAVVSVPPDEPGLDWEGELAVIVGRPLWQASPADAAAAVFGYAAFNDMTARTAQKLTTQWTLGKNVDGSGPMGEIVTSDEVGDISAGLAISTKVNGETVQSARTSEMIFAVDQLLSFVSHTLTLHPGDVMATGTPSGVGYVRNPPRFLTAGDVVEVEVERVGSVRTLVDRAGAGGEFLSPVRLAG